MLTLSPLQILANFCLFLTILMAIALQRVFFGPLRAIEVEVRGDPFLVDATLRLTDRLFVRTLSASL